MKVKSIPSSRRRTKLFLLDVFNQNFLGRTSEVDGIGEEWNAGVPGDPPTFEDGRPRLLVEVVPSRRVGEVVTPASPPSSVLVSAAFASRAAFLFFALAFLHPVGAVCVPVAVASVGVTCVAPVAPRFRCAAD